MKKIILATVAAISAILVGCKSMPTDDQMYQTSYACGTAAGLIAGMTKNIDDASRNAVCEIMNEVDGCIPSTNETFTAAWTPIAQSHVDRLIADGKIDNGQGVLIMGAFKVAVNGIDYVFNVKYPKARQYQELVEAASHGFVDGFLTVFKPANTFSAVQTVPVDKDAYNYLLETN